MTPLAISMLVDIGTLAHPKFPDSPAQREVLEQFIADELVHMVDGVPKVLPRGRAHLHFICMLPLPNASWAVPGFNLSISQGALL